MYAGETPEFKPPTTNAAEPIAPLETLISLHFCRLLCLSASPILPSAQFSPPCSSFTSSSEPTRTRTHRGTPAPARHSPPASVSPKKEIPDLLSGARRPVYT